MKVDDILKSKTVATAIIVIGALALLFVAFGLGVSVGFRKANFSNRWGDNYERNFGRRNEPRSFLGNPGVSGHGAAGRIMSISSSSIVIADPREGEAIVEVDGKTLIRRFNENISLTDLRPGDATVVIGSPEDNGRIRAQFIRILPSPSSGFSPSPTPTHNQ